MGGGLVATNASISGIITGFTISTGGTSGGTGGRVTMTSGYADTYWYSGSNLIFKVYDGVDHVQVGGVLPIRCSGNWIFTGNVTGVVAKWG